MNAKINDRFDLTCTRERGRYEKVGIFEVKLMQEFFFDIVDNEKKVTHCVSMWELLKTYTKSL